MGVTISGSSKGITCGCVSTVVTANPRFTRFSVFCAASGDPCFNLAAVRNRFQRKNAWKINSRHFWFDRTCTGGKYQRILFFVINVAGAVVFDMNTAIFSVNGNNL